MFCRASASIFTRYQTRLRRPWGSIDDILQLCLDKWLKWWDLAFFDISIIYGLLPEIGRKIHLILQTPTLRDFSRLVISIDNFNI